MRVFLHGFTGGPDAWDRVRERLDGPSLALALPGHAGEPVAGWDEAVDRIAARCHGAHLVGYSLGARLALGVLVKHPDRIRRATLVGVAAGTDDRAARAAWEASLARRLEENGIEAFVDHWQSLPLWASQAALPDELLARQRARRLSHDPMDLAGALRRLGLAAMPDLRPSLPAIRVPVDLVVGSLDTKFVALARDLAARCPAARVFVVPGVGHNVVLEAPEALARILEEPPNHLPERVAR